MKYTYCIIKCLIQLAFTKYQKKTGLQPKCHAHDINKTIYLQDRRVNSKDSNCVFSLSMGNVSTYLFSSKHAISDQKIKNKNKKKNFIQITVQKFNETLDLFSE